MKNEKITVQLLNILQPIQVVYSTDGEIYSEFVYANAATATVFDKNFKNISEEDMGLAVLQNLAVRKKALASAYKVPQDVISKMTKASEAEQMKMKSGGDFYGEN